MFTRSAEPSARPLLQTEFNEYDARFSPDGRWLAYASDSSGRPEVYVVSYPDLDQKHRVSNDGGGRPEWSRDGRELFYVSPGKLHVVPVTTGTDFSAGEPRVLFDELRVVGDSDERPRTYEFLEPGQLIDSVSYSVFPDGEHFLVLAPEPDSSPTRFRVVLNWFDELDRLAPGAGG